ncbi:hypothetical protein Taro_013324 [Colocasia esculenta]|uniref:Retrotransposon gag domain-containing protein n=1 Tax=Colocasia esculenta TaxID=4460 RepID=A0A843UBR0_COLES|nr:hypothetical protein [Colocasia esculenta]
MVWSRFDSPLVDSKKGSLHRSMQKAAGKKSSGWERFPPPLVLKLYYSRPQLMAQAPVPQAHDHDGPSIMEKFKRMAPPSFKGESDPLLAESWMREIEMIFRAIRCAEDDKVTLATYMLQERADVRWSSLLRTRFEDGAVEVAWDEFVRLFRAKFVPEHI